MHLCMLQLGVGHAPTSLPRSALCLLVAPSSSSCALRRVLSAPPCAQWQAPPFLPCASGTASRSCARLQLTWLSYLCAFEHACHCHSTVRERLQLAGVLQLTGCFAVQEAVMTAARAMMQPWGHEFSSSKHYMTGLGLPDPLRSADQARAGRAASTTFLCFMSKCHSFLELPLGPA